MDTLFMVRSNAKAGQEEAFNQWYTDVHLPEVLSIEGFQSAQRFALHQAQVQPEQPHGHLAVYAIDSTNVAATLARLGEATWLTMTDAIDPASVQISVFSALTQTLSASA